MADALDNLVLRSLRQFDERQARFEDGMQDLNVRLGSIEQQLTTLRADVTHVLHRMGRMDQSLLRIERQLDLVDAE